MTLRPHLVALIASTRPHHLAGAAASCADCDEVLIERDVTRRGQAAVRNSLLAQVRPGAVTRFCDDDDFAFSSRWLADQMSPGADVLAFSYFVNGFAAVIPDDPLAAAINRVGPWNWIIRQEAIARVGQVFDPARKVNTGAWAWLRLIDAGLRIEFMPGTFGYQWRRGFLDDSVTGAAVADLDLFRELRRRIDAAGRPDLLPHLDARMAPFGMTAKQAA